MSSSTTTVECPGCHMEAYETDNHSTLEISVSCHNCGYVRQRYLLRTRKGELVFRNRELTGEEKYKPGNLIWHHIIYFEGISMKTFMENFGNKLIKVNEEDDAQTGPHRLLETEYDVALSYEKEGYHVATIYMETEKEGDEWVIMAANAGNPFIQGYFIIEKDGYSKIPEGNQGFPG